MGDRREEGETSSWRWFHLRKHHFADTKVKLQVQAVLGWGCSQVRAPGMSVECRPGTQGSLLLRPLLAKPKRKASGWGSLEKIKPGKQGFIQERPITGISLCLAPPQYVLSGGCRGCCWWLQASGSHVHYFSHQKSPCQSSFSLNVSRQGPKALGSG